MSRQFGYPQFDEQGMKCLTCAGDAENDMMMDIAVYRVKAGEAIEFHSDRKETAALLVLGNVVFKWEGHKAEGNRADFIKEGPYCLHVCRGIRITVLALADSEVLVQKTDNEREFAPVFYTPDTCRDETFGFGLCEDRMVRTVRTVFDYENAPYSNMVNGEVINHQGSWSSYTPHSHPQPEVYYYRFQREEGFGACFGQSLDHPGRRSQICVDQSMKYYLAPMEGLTTYHFRRVYHKYYGGVEKYFTPFLLPG